MKKSILLIILFAYFGFNFEVKAQSTVDTAKVHKQLKQLSVKLIDLQTELKKTQDRLPIDSAAIAKTESKSEDALAASKKAAGKAVNGDLSDAKKAEKKASQAADAKDDANDAKKKLRRDHDKVKDLLKDIEKTNKKIEELKAQL